MKNGGREGGAEAEESGEVKYKRGAEGAGGYKQSGQTHRSRKQRSTGSTGPCHLVLRPLNGLQVDALLHHLPQRGHLPQLQGDRKQGRSVRLALPGWQ